MGEQCKSCRNSTDEKPDGIELPYRMIWCSLHNEEKYYYDNCGDWEA
jgi:hypothetical protein